MPGNQSGIHPVSLTATVRFWQERQMPFPRPLVDHYGFVDALERLQLTIPTWTGKIARYRAIDGQLFIVNGQLFIVNLSWMGSDRAEPAANRLSRALEDAIAHMPEREKSLIQLAEMSR